MNRVIRYLDHRRPLTEGRVTRAILLLSASLLLAACNTLLAGGSSSTETGDKVALNGRVAGGNGDGVPGVIVTLKGTSLADTTDILGAYRLSGTLPNHEDGSDTLLFQLNGQAVTKLGVTSLEADLPDVQIVQRGFSGSFNGSDTSITRIEGVITGDGIAAGDSVTATFFHNALADNYSGFIWFPPTTTTRNYTVHINVYGVGETLTGRSQDVPFNSLAGNIVIPDFNPGNLTSQPEAANKRGPQASFSNQPGVHHETP